MNHENAPRFCILQPDYVLQIVRKPRAWQPTAIDSVPPILNVLRQYHVASFAEAMDDLQRCNQHALSTSIDTWAVVQSTEAGL